jgi:glucose-6-phosphate 1-epimerase
VWQGVNIHPLWPNSCQLKQVLSFGETFAQTLYMTNNSDVDCEYTGALHSYFQISDPEYVTVDALSTAKFDDKLTAENDNDPQTLINCIGPVDRIYHSEQTMQIVDSHWQRMIEVESFNTNQWVLWNPGIKGAEAMSDIHNNGQQEFVCLEAANTQAQLLKAGQTCSMRQVVRILPL